MECSCTVLPPSGVITRRAINPRTTPAVANRPAAAIGVGSARPPVDPQGRLPAWAEVAAASESPVAQAPPRQPRPPAAAAGRFCGTHIRKFKSELAVSQSVLQRKPVIELSGTF